ncbi:MAG: 2-keto-3-deoxy-galactonokinase [Rhizobiaceae bacterium]|nr:2-keto-3-deoxy-galactonokinase [Rhizobiaceae bacterium]
MAANQCNSGGLIVLDWGTTNVRLALLNIDGSIVEERRGESGVGTFSHDEFEAHFDRLTGGWPQVPAIAAGMVGSRQGWREAQYLACPASTNDLVQGLQHFCHDGRPITIVPGLTLNDGQRFDVMRGEESQIAGFLTQQPHYSGTLLMPGTHSKWVRIVDGTVVSFQTYMTGEMFEALSEHTILRHSLSKPSNDTDRFLAKVAQLSDEPSSFEGALFGLRARHLLTNSDATELHQELSALLILSELKAGLKDGFSLHDEVILIGSEGLTGLYQGALKAMNINATCIRGTGLVWPALFDLACKSNLITGTRA